MPSDGFMLVAGLPLLLGALALARRGSLAGLLAWPGLLFVVLYIYLPYVTAAPLSLLFLLHLALVAVSAATLIGLMAGIDADVIRRSARSGPARTGGGILAGLALFIIVRQVVVIGAALTASETVDPIERASWIADFVVAVPALLIVGVQLWRRSAFGCAASPELLLGYGLLALSVIPFFVAEAQATGATLDWAGVAVILAMAALCLVPFRMLAGPGVAGLLLTGVADGWSGFRVLRSRLLHWHCVGCVALPALCRERRRSRGRHWRR